MDPDEPIKSRRLYEEVVERLSRRIFDGSFEHGDQLPNERKLAETYGVSRTVIREAMRTLVNNGLVEVRTGQGTFVVDDTAKALKSSIHTLMRFGDERDRLREMVELRELLEPGIAGLAARRASSDDLEKLRQAIGAMDDAMGDETAYIAADNRFHLQLAHATGNRLIPRILDSIVDLLNELRGEIFRVEGGPERGQSHHRRIYAAVEDHDAAAARQAMDDHLAQVKRDTEAATRAHAARSGRSDASGADES